MSWGYWGGFAPYVSKAEKLRRSERARAALAKKGVKLEPVAVNGREISRTWWGKAWTQNLERYADYSNRIPRGRTYVRSGAVLDLKITPNTITALVSGSRPQPYKIEVGIKPLDKKVEKALMESSRASLDSMQALLSGEFPADLKQEFFQQGTGLFPSPRQIKLGCSCPDWAEMCKHVAAALYGTAVRLDEKPELFFTLRGIRVEDFVGKMVKQESEKILKRAKQESVRVIATDNADVSALFGIAMDGAGVKLEGRSGSVAAKPGRAKPTKLRATKKATASAGAGAGIATRKTVKKTVGRKPSPQPARKRRR